MRLKLLTWVLIWYFLSLSVNIYSYIQKCAFFSLFITLNLFCSLSWGLFFSLCTLGTGMSVLSMWYLLFLYLQQLLFIYLQKNVFFFLLFLILILLLESFFSRYAPLGLVCLIYLFSTCYFYTYNNCYLYIYKKCAFSYSNSLG